MCRSCAQTLVSFSESVSYQGEVISEAAIVNVILCLSKLLTVAVSCSLQHYQYSYISQLRQK